MGERGRGKGRDNERNRKMEGGRKRTRIKREMREKNERDG